MIHRNQPYEEYAADPAMRASDLVHGLRSYRQLRWSLDGKAFVRPDVVRVGQAAHSIVEYLPRDRFTEFFVVMPDFSGYPGNQTDSGKPSKSRATNWCKEQEAAFREGEKREVLTVTEYQRLVRIVEALSQSDDAMRLIKNTEPQEKEIGVFAEIEGVNCKARIDGIGRAGWWDLKTVRNLDRFKWDVRSLRYLEKSAFHLMVMRECGFNPELLHFIAVEDTKPAEGRYPRCPECCVYEVPSVALENYVPVLQELLRGYLACVAGDCWPGMQGGPLEIVDMPDMPEVTLVD